MGQVNEILGLIPKLIRSNLHNYKLLIFLRKYIL